MTAWIYLSAAIVLEVSGTVLLKLSNGFEKSFVAATFEIWLSS